MDTAPITVQTPYMLDHLTADAQRISASLPPDDWDSEVGVLDLQSDSNGLVVLPPSPVQDDDQATRVSHGSLLQRLKRLIRTAVRRLRRSRKDAKSS